MSGRAPVRVAVWLAVAATLAACGGGGGGGGDGGVAATLADYSISLDPSSVAAGSVSFDITNDGPQTHEFVVFKTDLAPDALPVSDGLVEEESPDLELIGEVEDIAAGATATLEENLDAGSYVVICNIVTHYELGMRTELTVG